MAKSALRSKTKTNPKAKTNNLTSTRFSKPILILFALIFAGIGGYALYRSFAAGPVSCTTTVNSISTIESAVSSATGGSLICVSAGSYGDLSLTGTPTSNVTVEPDPSQDPNGAGKVTFTSINVTGSYITVRNFYSTGGINFNPPSSHDTADHNDVTNVPGGYGISMFCNTATQPGCSYMTISNNKIHDLMSSPDNDGDAVRLDGWANDTVTGNDIYDIEQLSGSGEGHTDCLQSYQNNVNTENITYDHNYVHDSQCQVFFLKDGDVSSGVVVTDNLAVRDANSGLSDTAIWLDSSSQGVIIRNNTLQNTGGSALDATGTTPNASAFVDHNVFDAFNTLGGYALTENNNIYTGGNEWSFTLDPTDQPQAYGVTVSPNFMCGSICGNGTLAGDDYRLASNPNNIGVDWAPSQYTYGPINDGGGGSGGSTPAPTVSLNANPTSISSGSSSTLTWSSSNATSCTASGAWSGDEATSGSQSTGNLTSSSTYNLSCAGAGGTTNASAIVTVTSSGGGGGGGSTINIGETTILPNADNNNANLLLAQSATLSQAATIQSLSFYVTTASGNLRLGIYDSSGPSGGPGKLLASTAEIVTSSGWDTASVTTPVLLQPGTYWLAYLPSSNGLGFVKTSDSTSSGVGYSYTYAAMPSTFSTSPTIATTSHWSFYATLSTSSGTSSVPGDCNGDGHVNINDLSLLLSEYGTNNTACDFNKDGVVNILDFSILLAHYGT